MKKDNGQIGNMGVDSIRIGGQKPENLPIAEQVQTRAQMVIARENELKQKIADIKAKYPTQTVAYLQSRIVECRENITRIQVVKTKQESMISEYTSLIALCEQRDRNLEPLSEVLDEDIKDSKIKELREEYPPYDVIAMRQQVLQAKEGAIRCDDVIAQENVSIAEFTQVKTLCEVRDRELRNVE